MEESTHFQAASKNRLFYSIPDKGVSDQSILQSEEDHGEKFLKYISENTIGKNKIFSGPFGLRQVTYLDYIASGRPLKFIEDYICNEVLPDYGNTHTTTSVTSLQTTLYRHEARDIIRNSVHASEHDSVIFCGSGTTGAVHKLIHALNLSQPPVVFVGPYEHHSNFLPWETIGAKIVRIKEDEKGRISIYDLQQKLQKWKATNQQLIGCFSAASNITGILVDINAVTVCLHRNGALAFWDYATAAPYVKLDMNPVVTSSEDQPFVYKDAMFLSPHKFVGGVQTPGVLVAKKKLFNNSIPEKCGGGSVFYVRRDGHRFLQEPELREEGGTPAIVEAIRAGLVFQLKDAVTPELIMKKEEELFRHSIRYFKNCENLVILGNVEVPRLPVFSFLVYNPQSGRFLHHNFVASILNDLFGIQARGGCACAGPYAMDLLGLDEKTASEIEDLLAEDTRLDRTHLRRYREYSQREILRPGFVRINLPFSLEQETLNFALEAIKIVAKDGWKLLPQYMFNPETGEWRQKNFQVFKDRKWLGHISYNSGEMKYQVPPHVVKGPLPVDYKDCLQKVRHLLKKVEKSRPQLPDHRQMFDDKSQRYRWFMLPSEAATCLSGDPISSFSSQLPFCPPQIREEIGLPPFVLEVQKNDGVVVDGYLEKCHLSDSAKQRSDKFTNSFVQRLENGYNCDDSNGRQCVINSTKKHDTDSNKNCDNDSTQNCDIDSMVNSSSDSKQKCDLVQSATEEKSSIGFENNHTDKILEISDTSSTLKQQKTDNLPFEQGLCNKVISGDRSGTPVTEECTNLCDKVKVQDVGSNTLGADGNGAPSVEECPEDLQSQTYKEQKTETAEDCNSEKSAENGENMLSTHVPDSLVCDSLSSVSTTLCSNKKRDRCENNENTCEISTDSEMCTLPKTRKFDSLNKVEPPDVCTIGDNVTTNSACTRKTEAILPNMVVNDSAEKTTKSESTAGKRKKFSKWYSPPKCIFTPFLKGVEDYSMIRDGDSVLVCLSGGKDSLSLLHTVRQCQFYSRSKGIHFQLGAVTVDPQTNSYDPSPLKQYLASLNVPYFYESQCIMEQAKSLSECASICSFCSRMKRGRIYACARKNGYNVLALGQHLDDLCESFLMSFFHNGILRTMKAHYDVEEGDLRVIRPFVYVREKDLRTFAEKNKLPVIAENCPACFDAPKERHRTKQLLASQEILFPHIYNSMMAAMKPVMAINKTGVRVKDYLARPEEDDMEI